MLSSTAVGLLATGYIWHSYLESTMMYVANVEWVNVHEVPDK